jgi:quinol-cytochrome oxidoreductase complex cytochrome b subunit
MISLKISYISFFLWTIFDFPYWLEDINNNIETNSLVTPSRIIPEWYLLPYYAILRSIPNKWSGIWWILFSLLVLFILPYIENLINISFRLKYIAFDNVIFYFFFNFFYLYFYFYFYNINYLFLIFLFLFLFL